MESPAVFLSYAREDAAAARRIAEALRAAGLEVWFDENELRGGDAWDAKIRQQIDACALFIPIVSQHTQARGKGYFRLEWKLAVEQTHLMAAGIAYLAPVVIDDTPEGGALVPAEFLKVQWTRLPGALPSPQFVAQIQRLLAPQPAATATATRTVAAGPTTPGTPPHAARPGNRTLISAGVLALGGLAAATYIFLQPKSSSPSGGIEPPALSVERSSPPAPVAAADKSIAVLPFANMSPEAENAFFADGIHEDVITSLAKIRDLKVISRTSVLAYRDAASRNLKKIAAELGVASVLEGSVRRAGNKVRVTAQLIDARTDKHLWAETYDRDLTDIFALQGELAREITGALKANLTAGERTLIERRPTENPEAYDAYQRALLLHRVSASASREQYEAVLAMYEQAIARDPDFALAHVQLTFVHGVMYWFGQVDPTPERRTRARAALEAAQRLAPDSPETHYARGAFAYLCDNDWPRAMEEYRAAETGLPNEAQLQYRIAITHRRLGQFREALQRLDHAVALSPNDLSSISTQVETLIFLRRYPRALELARRYLAAFPASSQLEAFRIQAQLALDGDRPAYRQGLAALPATAFDPLGLEKSYLMALGQGDLAAADRLLADPRLIEIASPNGAVTHPVALHRAQLAWLRGDLAAAKIQATATIAAYQQRRWTPRQEPLVRLGLAQAGIYAAPTDEAVQELRAALQEVARRDRFIGFTSLLEVAETFALVGRRDDALAGLRDYFAGPSDVSPAEVRQNPFLASLKADPRFEEILQSAKPL